MVKRSKGYKLPALIDPGDFVCIQAEVPNDPLYIAAFWGSYEFLTKWLAWEENGTDNAAQAASIWRTRFESSRDKWLLGDGACGIAPPEDVIEPWQYLLQIIGGIKWMLEQVNIWLQEGRTTAWILAMLGPVYSRMPGLADLIDDMASESYEDRTTALENFDYEELLHEIWCGEPDCTIRNWSGVLGFLQWTQCIAAKIANWLQYQSGLVAGWLQDISADLLNGQAQTSLAALVPNGGDLFGIEPYLCPFVQVFPWDQEDNWNLFPIPGQSPSMAGVFNSGVGWLAQYVEFDSSSWRYSADISIEFTDTLITEIRFICNTPSHHTYQFAIIQYLNTSDIWIGSYQEVDDNQDDIVITLNEEIRGIRLGVASAEPGARPGPPGYVPQWILEAQVSGNGDNPFE